jgi:hypothetical protein
MIMDKPMVEGAEQHQIVDVRRAAAPPVNDVVSVQEPLPITPWELATMLVTDS